MKEKPVFVVALNTTVLPRARFFGQLENPIQSGFKQHSIHIDRSSPILKSNQKNIWRVVSENNHSIESFKLELSYNKNSDEEVVKVFEDTVSGLPKQLWDFKIFTSDVHTPISKQKIYYTGATRHGLSTKQKLKWDFFFRPDIDKLNDEFDSLIFRCEDDLSEATKILSKSIRTVIICALVFLVYFRVHDSEEIGVTLPIALLAIALSIYLFFSLLNGKLSLNINKLRKEVKSLKLYLNAFREERSSVFADLEDIDIPDGAQIDQWIDEEIMSMQEESKGKFIFSDSKKEIDTLRGFAIYQLEFIDIQKRFSKKITTFYGFRVFQKKLIYSGLYVVFIFQNDEKICISKFFYDFILSKKFREENLEYHYSDLVGVAINSKLIHNPFEEQDQEESVENKEINTIWISFTDSNDVQIAVIDKDTSESIAQRLINDDGEQGFIDDVQFWDQDHHDSLNDEDDLDMNKAYKIIKHIKERKSSLNQ